MSEAFFKVFTKYEYHDVWDKQIEFMSLTENLDATVRSNYISSLQFLQTELGRGFLKSAHKHHPIKMMIGNKALWQLTDLIKLVQTLQYLKEQNNANYDLLKDKLLPAESCRREAIPFCDIARSYFELGFEISFLNERNSIRTPDLCVKNLIGNEKFYIEVSKLEESNQTKNVTRNYHTLFDKFHFTPPQHPFTCKQLEIIADDEMPAVLSKIQGLKEKVDKEKQMLFYRDNKLDLVMTHLSKIDEIREYCSVRNVRMDLIGLPTNYAETDRIIRNEKIKDKANQIPEDSFGIIYFPLHPLYFWVTDLESAIEKFEKEIKQYPNLFGVVLYSYIGNITETFSAFKGMHFYSKRMTNQANSRDLFFVCNEECKHTISKELLDKIYFSFENFGVTFV